MTKPEKIQEAYNSFPNLIRHIKEDNGWCGDKFGVIFNKYKNNNLFEVQSNTEHTNGTIRLKSIKGIEDNNGWIKIESKNDLPTENIDCFYLTNHNECKSGRFFVTHFRGWENVFTIDGVIAFGINYVTHYQPIIKPNLPLY